MEDKADYNRWPKTLQLQIKRQNLKTLTKSTNMPPLIGLTKDVLFSKAWSLFNGDEMLPVIDFLFTCTQFEKIENNICLSKFFLKSDSTIEKMFFLDKLNDSIDDTKKEEKTVGRSTNTPISNWIRKYDSPYITNSEDCYTNCTICKIQILNFSEEIQKHYDFHFAMDLVEKEKISTKLKIGNKVKAVKSGNVRKKKSENLKGTNKKVTQYFSKI